MAHSPKRSEKLKYVEIKCPNRNYIQFSRWWITHTLLGYMPYNSWDAHLSIIMAYYGHKHMGKKKHRWSVKLIDAFFLATIGIDGTEISARWPGMFIDIYTSLGSSISMWWLQDKLTTCLYPTHPWLTQGSHPAKNRKELQLVWGCRWGYSLVYPW